MEEDEKKKVRQKMDQKGNLFYTTRTRGRKGRKGGLEVKPHFFLNGWVAQVRLEGEREKAGL